MAMSIAVESAAHGKRVLWGAPTFDQVRISWDETKHGADSVAKFTQQRMTAEFPSGGRIIYRSLDDPNNARGHTADGVVIDEVGDVKAAAWYEVLRPMLIDTNGWAWAIGTPRGQNWFWREHHNASERADSVSWQVATLGAVVKDGRLIRKPHPLENPHIPFSELEQIWDRTPENTFRQEILAEFIADSGGVFRGVMAAATAEPQEKRVSGHEYIFGIDWAKHNDYTVIAVLDATTSDLVCLDRFSQIDYQTQLGRFEGLYIRFEPGQIIAERNAMGEPLIEQLFRQGYPVQPFTTTNASKAQMVDALALAFERKDIRIIPDPVLIGELQAFESRRLPSGMLRYEAPEGMHDDTVIALGLAWHGVAHQSWVIS